MLLFPRQIGLQRQTIYDRDSYNKYIQTLNGKASLYTSLYHFEETKTGEYGGAYVDVESVVMDRAWWDFDTTEEHDIIQVKKDVAVLLNRLSDESDIRIVATGRGFHIHQFFEKPVKGTAIQRHIDRYQRQMGVGLATLDGVGHPQKLTRIPDTYNPKRNRWCVNIHPRVFKENPLEYQIPKEPRRAFRQFDPFRGAASSSKFCIIQWIKNNPDSFQTAQNSVEIADLEIGTALDIPLPACLEKAISTENPRHEIRVALVLYLSQNLRFYADLDTIEASQKQTIVDNISEYIGTLNWRDYQPSITKQQVSYIVNNYNHSPSPQWYRRRGYCNGKCWFCSD